MSILKFSKSLNPDAISELRNPKWLIYYSGLKLRKIGKRIEIPEITNLLDTHESYIKREKINIIPR